MPCAEHPLGVPVGECDPSRVGPDVFRDARAGFDFPRIACLVELCSLAYADPQAFRSTALQAGWSGGEVLSAGAAQAGIVWCEHSIAVVVRGSSESRDWWDDLISQVRVGWSGVLPDGAKMGLGFKRQAAALFSVSLLSRLRWLFASLPSARFYLAGHSLGGAIAAGLVAAIHLSLGRLPSFPPVLVDPPKAGNGRLARHVEGLTPVITLIHIYRGEADIVTRLPATITGARHVGHLLLLDSDTGTYSRSWEEWDRFRASHPVGLMRGQWRLLSRLVRSVRAHFPPLILQTLYQIIKKEQS